MTTVIIYIQQINVMGFNINDPLEIIIYQKKKRYYVVYFGTFAMCVMKNSRRVNRREFMLYFAWDSMEFINT